MVNIFPGIIHKALEFFLISERMGLPEILFTLFPIGGKKHPYLLDPETGSSNFEKVKIYYLGKTSNKYFIVL